MCEREKKKVTRMTTFILAKLKNKSVQNNVNLKLVTIDFIKDVNCERTYMLRHVIVMLCL